MARIVSCDLLISTKKFLGLFSIQNRILLRLIKWRLQIVQRNHSAYPCSWICEDPYLRNLYPLVLKKHEEGDNKNRAVTILVAEKN